MCLDLTPENVATVTDVIRYQYAHEPDCSELSSRLGQQRHGVLRDDVTEGLRLG